MKTSYRRYRQHTYGEYDEITSFKCFKCHKEYGEAEPDTFSFCPCCGCMIDHSPQPEPNAEAARRKELKRSAKQQLRKQEQAVRWSMGSRRSGRTEWKGIYPLGSEQGGIAKPSMVQIYRKFLAECRPKNSFLEWGLFRGDQLVLIKKNEVT